MNSACPLCSQRQTSRYSEVSDIEYFTTDESYSMLRCKPCDVIYIDPMPFDKMDVIYPSNYYSFNAEKKSSVSAIKEWLDRRALRKLSQQLEGDNLSVLDVGGGTGWLVNQLRTVEPRFTKSLIVDLDQGAADRAHAAGHEFYLGRFEDVPDTGRRFDLILMLNLIEHVVDPKAVLRKAAGLLAPGGLIWIKTPNFDSLDGRLFRDTSWGGYHAPRHFVIFNRNSFERMVRDTGLSIQSFKYTQGAPFWAISLLELARRAGLVRIDRQHPSIYHPLTPPLQAAGAAFDFLRIPFGARTSQMVFTLTNIG